MATEQNKQNSSSDQQSNKKKSKQFVSDKDDYLKWIDEATLKEDQSRNVRLKKMQKLQQKIEKKQERKQSQKEKKKEAWVCYYFNAQLNLVDCICRNKM